eukprot:CAMPEP_0170418902 /NCGR_PEP_ID=MMETSP0117_2-20130122/34512_1 /TAXON_ID=400756 /ORGANISM="Durinskia baltica, Strain CSIRO CS-38" /LENGTH=122 /DNA_ID=CAMNT_0010677215 /DNA_START=35 /DNA_END=400 /DNA_ORIENTATION=-
MDSDAESELQADGETEASDRPDGAVTTTFIVRGVPRQYSAWELVRELDETISREAYDFVYVPRKRHARANMGFAFVNFVAEKGVDIEACCARLCGQCWTGSSGTRLVTVSRAELQGLEGNLR